MHLNVFVSRKCFSYCNGCYSYSREEKCNDIVITEDIIKFLNYAYSRGIQNVTFCGGDPLTRYDIVDLLEKTKNIGYNISLDTLGSNLIKNIINNKGNIIYKRIEPKIISKYIDTIGIPIDGSSNNIINIFRQSNTDIVKEQQLICKELSKYCKNICINTVVHKGNIDDALELTKLVNNLDFINKWQLFKYIPTGKFGTKNKEIYDITTEQFNKFKDIVKSNYISNDKLQVYFKM